jgi:hypothetical protein
MSTPPEIVLRFATLWILMVVPGYKVLTIRNALQRFRRDGRDVATDLLPWTYEFDVYRRETYVPEAGPLVDRLHAWMKVLFGAIAVVMLGVAAWNYIDPPRM